METGRTKELEAFTIWRKSRKRFLILIVSIALVIFLGLPVCLTFLSTFMHREFIGIPLIWLYAFFQIITTWLVGWIYWRKSLQLDRLLTRVKEEGKT